MARWTRTCRTGGRRDRASVWSLYGPTRRPSSEMLAGIDTIVFDIQDVGARYYTYLATLVYVLEEAGRRGIAVVVLDRPNPITGRIVEGPVMDADLGSFTAPHPIPVRTGMTMGEFARMVVAERKLPVSLTVVPLENWDRGRWFDQTGLPWSNPSPNIRSTTPGAALLRHRAPRGDEPLGRPGHRHAVRGDRRAVDHESAGARRRAQPQGLRRGPVRAGALHAQRRASTPGRRVGGVRFVVTDREAIRPVTVSLGLARELVERYSYFRPAAIQNLLVNRATMWSFLRGSR